MTYREVPAVSARGTGGHSWDDIPRYEALTDRNKTINRILIAIAFLLFDTRGHSAIGNMKILAAEAVVYYVGRGYYEIKTPTPLCAKW